MKKVTLKIDNKEYDISLKDDIARAVEELIAQDFTPHGNITVKELLYAYIKASIENETLKNEIDAIHTRVTGLTY